MSIAQEIITLAVIGCYAVLADGIAVLLRGVALVGKPVVLGVFLCEIVHVVITVGLRKDTRSGYREILAVALDNGGMGQGVHKNYAKKYWFLQKFCIFAPTNNL